MSERDLQADLESASALAAEDEGEPDEELVGVPTAERPEIVLDEVPDTPTDAPPSAGKEA